MSQEKAYQLMERTYKRPKMRVADNLLEIEEAQRAADAMYAILQDNYEWKWPEQGKHSATWEDKRGECKRDPVEDDAQYQNRMKKWHVRRKYKTDEQARWLRCAIITSRALHYLQQYFAENPAFGDISLKGFFFRPDSFYEYVWICLNQGYGTQQWKTSPVMPSDSENDDAWFALKAQELLNEVVGSWEKGCDLELMFPLPSLDDILPTPYHKEAISVVRAKLGRFTA